MAAQKTASTEAPTATTIRSRRNSAPSDEFGGVAFDAMVVVIRSFLSGCAGIGYETELDGTGHATQRPCGTPRSAGGGGGCRERRPAPAPDGRQEQPHQAQRIAHHRHEHGR